MTKDDDYVDPVTEEHFTAIGRIIVRWAITERLLMELVWEIATGQSFDALGQDASISLALVTGMDARVKLGILKAVFRARHPDDGDEFDKLANKLGKLGQVRNVIAHGHWLAGQRPGTIEAASWRATNRLAVETHAFTARELHSAAERIKDCTWRLAEFLQARGYWKSSPPTERALTARVNDER
jgi:hypothetical protein